VTEPRDGAPDDLEPEPLDENGEPSEESTADEIDEGAPTEIDDEDIQDDLVDETEADVDAEVDDYDAAIREVAGEPALPPPPVRPGERGPRERRRTTTPPQRAPTPSEIAVHVREDWSRAFVIVTVAVFTLILLNAIFLGHGGLLTPVPTPTPEPTPSPSISASPSESAAPSESALPSASAAPSVSASPSGSAAPSSAAPSSAEPSVAPS
jgi:hypothetical protein